MRKEYMPGKVRWLAVLALTTIFLLIHVSSGEAEDSGKLRTSAGGAREHSNAEAIVASHAGGSFTPSLEMRESADFLIAPALFVQEALSEEPSVSDRHEPGHFTKMRRIGQAQRSSGALGLAANLASERVSTLKSDGSLLQFDVILETTTPSLNAHVTLFVRYWVGPDFYEAALIWGEPHGRGLSFPAYPATLRIESSPTDFGISHDLFTNVVQRYEKPIDPQTVFTNRFGDYGIGSIRFADAAATQSRLKVEALLATKDKSTPGGEVSITNAATGEITNLTLNEHFPSIETLSVLGPDDRTLKTVSFRYSGSEKARYLQEQSISMPERPIRARLGGAGAKIRMGGTNYQINEFGLTDLLGGREWNIHYSPIQIGRRTVALPTNLIVRTAKGRFLRRIRFDNYELVGLSQESIKAAAEAYSGFGSPEKKYRGFLDKYWEKNRLDVADGDVRRIQGLIEHFKKPLAVGASTGEKVRRINILMELYRILEMDDELVRSYREYLSILNEVGLVETMLVGGQTAIDTVMTWGRLPVAERLVAEWVKFASRAKDDEIIIRFCERELKKGNCWTTARFLEEMSEKSPEKHTFEIASFHCLAFDLTRVLFGGAITNQTPLLSAQKRWVQSSVKPEWLRNRHREIKAEVERLYAQIPDPSARDTLLVRRVRGERIQASGPQRRPRPGHGQPE